MFISMFATMVQLVQPPAPKFGEMASVFLLVVPARSPLDASHAPDGFMIHFGVVKSPSLKSSKNNQGTCIVTGMLNCAAPVSFVEMASTAL